MTKHKYIVPARQLAALRYLKDINQKKLAEFLGINPATYSRKERGELLFNLNEINALLDVFDVPFEKLFRRRARNGL